MHGFKPFGIAFCDTAHVIMQYEEYETVKLVIYDNLSQDAAAEKMEVSRPTLTRIYNSTIKKLDRHLCKGNRSSLKVETSNLKKIGTNAKHVSN